MWDYDKLFAEGNILGIKNLYTKQVLNSVVDTYSYDYWFDDYKNNELSSKNCKVNVDYNVGHGYTTDFEIQYIIRLDEHGNVVEKLFNRETDMTKPMPELETGMFVRVEDEGLGYVDTRNNRIVYQHGGYDVLVGDEYLPNVLLKIIEVYSENACAFSYCNDDVLIWRDSDYQAYLDSKSN